MREKGPTKIRIKAIDPQKFFVPRAYENLNLNLFLVALTDVKGSIRDIE
jgi:hypothetical protein